MPGQIIAEIDEFGRPTIKAKGLPGGKCKGPIANFDKMIAGEKEIKATAEMSMTSTNTNTNTHAS